MQLARMPTVCVSIGVLGHWWRFQERRTEDMELEEALLRSQGTRVFDPRTATLSNQFNKIKSLSVVVAGLKPLVMRHCIHFTMEQGSL